MTSYNLFKQKLSVLKAALESEGGFTLGHAVEINRNKMSIPLTIENDMSFKVQLPECGTKQGIVSTGSRTYIDLVFDCSMDNAYLLEFEDFVSQLQSKCAREIYNNRSEWLATDLEDADEDHSIETFEEMFYPVTRAINRGANKVLRVDIGRSSRGTNAALPPETSCEVYDKNGEERPLTSIHRNSRLIPLVEFSELIISSTSINLVVELKECLLLDKSSPITKKERSIMLENPYNVSEQENRQTKEESEEQKTNSIEPLQTNVTENERGYENFSAEVEADGSDKETHKSYNGENEELVEVEINVDDEDEQNDPQENEEGLTEINDLEVIADEPLTLKEPNEVYREIYKAAIAKAKRLRQVALDAYLDAKKIKARFMLDNIDDSEDEEDMEDSEDLGQSSFYGN